MASEEYRVLLVDDDEDDYVVTQDLLSEATQVQFELDWVDTYHGGLEAIGSNCHDVYLLDYRLGPKTGLDLLQAAIAAGCGQPFILLTGMGSYEIDQQALALGASDYLIKGIQLTAPLLERTILHAIRRKQAQQALKDSEARYRLLFQEANDLVLIHPLGRLDQPGYPFADVNDAACRLLGYSREELCQLTPANLIAPEELADLPTELSILIDTQELLFEKTLIAKDGTRIPAELHAHVFDWHGTPTVLSVARDITERKAHEARLRESQDRLTLATTATNQGIWEWDVLNDRLFWDERMYGIYGVSPGDFEVSYAAWQRTIHPEDLAAVELALQAAIARPQEFHAEFRILWPNGQVRFLEAQALTVRDASGRAIRMTGVNRDISDRKQTELERDRFFNLALDLLFIADQDGVLKRINPAWTKALGYGPEALLGQSFWDLIHPEDEAAVVRARDRLGQGQDMQAIEVRCRTQSGNYLWTAWNAVPFLQEHLLYGAGRDISQRKQSEANLVYETLHDGLTGLYNRAYFLQRLETATKQVKRQTNYTCAVLFIDLDNFKNINDSLGHLVGDQLLIQVARVLRAAVREVDTVARLGGDEFTILVENSGGLNDILTLAQRIQDQIQASFCFDAQEIFTSASIGIVLSNPIYQSAADIIRDADIAMYRAKANGKGCHEVFDQAMYAEMLRLAELSNALRRAIDRQELHLHYQPIISMEPPHPIAGFEVLLRWYHPQKGLIPASEFIPIAEETGQINEIGMWVLECACRQFKRWQAEGRDLSNEYISVNLSGRQLREPDLLNSLDRILAETQMPTQNLKLEVTETSLVENIDTAIPMLEGIRERGIEISLDDFGTGFSSLRYLHQFPISIIKIDRSFVETLHKSDRDRSIVESIITLAKALGFTTVAEGIETYQQFEQLKALGCNVAQGYLFAKPMSQENIEQVIDSGAMAAFPIQQCCSTGVGV